MNTLAPKEKKSKIALVMLGSCLVLINAPVVAAENEKATRGVSYDADSMAQMIKHGKVDGYLRVQWDYTNDAFFVPGKDQRTAAYGGNLNFTTASLYGFSLRLGWYAQRNIFRSSDPNKVVRPLGNNLETLGEAYVQWKDDDLRLRAGNQKIHGPFTQSFNFRIIPQTYQGLAGRYGDDSRYLTVMRMIRYKDRPSSSFHRYTNYSKSHRYSFPPPRADQETSGFWAVGAADNEKTESFDIDSQAWFFNYRDYANMYYADGHISFNKDGFTPFFGLQWIRETDTGKALLGNVDHHTYGAQAGVRYKSLKFALNYDYIPHRENSFLNGGLVAPYAHAVGDIPYFAHTFPNSVEDLGSGNISSVSLEEAPTGNSKVKLQYTYADLTKDPDAGSQRISEYLLQIAYNFGGALDGLAIHENVIYQSSPFYAKSFFTSRFGIEYRF